ncbi:polysaccharide deacetylase family protein [Aquabacter cavernae]|uniref:polysaccharide deacetylase family protein n=1 Tax=Aquabacter cavernae TaxID=2496029 RepID=UPI000F8E8B1B|nr:polysaccharide deacetylase family protein [Aquabacter cavernae]
MTVSACAAAVLALGLVAGQVLFSDSNSAAANDTAPAASQATAPAAPAKTAAKPVAAKPTVLADASPSPAPGAATPGSVQAAAPAPFWGPTPGQGSAGSLGLPSLPTMAAPPPPPSATSAAVPLEGDSAPPGMPAPEMAAGSGNTARGPRAYNAVQTDSPYVAITFDDGPNPETTPKLLKMLADRNIKATFFVLGSRAVASPEILRAMVAAGHEVANHSWNHPQLTKLTVAAVDKQIEDTNAAIFEATGVKSAYLRPPYGSMNGTLQQHIIDKYQMSFIYWSVDPLDWKNRDPNAIYDQIMRQVHPGSIILAHDIHPTTVAAMPRVLDALLAKGYKFMTVSELIAQDKPGTAKVASAVPAAAPKKKVRPTNGTTASTAAPTTTGSTRPSSQRGPVNISPVPVNASGATRPPAAVTTRPPASAGIY